MEEEKAAPVKLEYAREPRGPRSWTRLALGLAIPVGVAGAWVVRSAGPGGFVVLMLFALFASVVLTALAPRGGVLASVLMATSLSGTVKLLAWADPTSRPSTADWREEGGMFVLFWCLTTTCALMGSALLTAILRTETTRPR